MRARALSLGGELRKAFSAEFAELVREIERKRAAYRVMLMTYDEMVRIYFQKHQVNLNRQEKGYNEDTKTEEDHLAIRIG